MGKPLYIEARKKFNPQIINFSALNKLKGKSISLASTAQYLGFVQAIKNHLEKSGNKVIIKNGAYYPAHVLGCNPTAFDKNADTLLLLADGKFHALNNAVYLGKEINIFNLQTLEKISQKQIQKIQSRAKAKQKKFLASDKIGILISTKHGQKYPSINQLKQKIKNLGKQVYVFESDNIDLQELENFQDIEIWVNTACPGLGLEDSRIVNLRDILGFI